MSFMTHSFKVNLTFFITRKLHENEKLIKLLIAQIILIVKVGIA